jgi:translation elongation factor EF-1beta
MMDIQQRIAEYRRKLSRVFQESFIGDEKSHIAFMDVNALEIGIITDWEDMESRIAELEQQLAEEKEVEE